MKKLSASILLLLFLLINLTGLSSFIDKLDEDVKYYIYDKYWAEQQGTAEIESNLPYKKIKETENYIIYDIKTKVTE